MVRNREISRGIYEFSITEQPKGNGYVPVHAIKVDLHALAEHGPGK